MATWGHPESSLLSHCDSKGRDRLRIKFNSYAHECMRMHMHCNMHNMNTDRVIRPVATVRYAHNAQTAEVIDSQSTDLCHTLSSRL